MKIKSPLTKSNNTKLIDEITASFITYSYKKQLNIDVQRFFQNIKKIQIYKCLDTGYKFYYPFNITGDSEFYEDLEIFPWYYMGWKWEHEIASNIIKPKDKVLEIGCGKGSFLRRMQEKGAYCVGLELNENITLHNQSNNVKILNEFIQNHAKNNHVRYDIVCSFQVLEHIAEIGEFIQASIDTLKPSGKLIISVPNNYRDSIVLKDNILNMPPHHMGLWNSVSLANLQNIFPLKLELLEIEPIQKYHIGYYQTLVESYINNSSNLLENILKRQYKYFAKQIIRDLSDYLLGHTIIAVYKKL